MRKNLINGHRQAFTRAYRTTSADALPVLAGVPYVDLLLTQRGRTYATKKNWAYEDELEGFIQAGKDIRTDIIRD